MKVVYKDRVETQPITHVFWWPRGYTNSKAAIVATKEGPLNEKNEGLLVPL